MAENHTAIIFDLDDTLYKEIDFLVSAYHVIAQEVDKLYNCPDAFDYMMNEYRHGRDAFGALISKYNVPISKEQLLQMYRHHIPSITLSRETKDTLRLLKKQGIKMGLMTDGRAVTQRNKITALGLHAFLDTDAIIISEEFGSSKPCRKNYEYFVNLFQSDTYYYIGDNPAKDFVTPNAMGWRTVCLANDGRNIHPQDIATAENYQPSFTIYSITEILNLLSHHEQ